MKILDAHIHLGTDCVFDETQTEEQIVTLFDKVGVTGGIVQPFLERPYIDRQARVHDRIKAMCQAYPGRFWGMVSLNPHMDPAEYDAEAARCVKKLGFVAIKITPIGHACNPNSADAYHVYEVARGLGVPMMIHTGNGIPFADPAQLRKPIKDFPDVRFVIAHGGLDTFSLQAIQLAEEFDNAYLEPSWVSVVTLAAMKKRCGAAKIMFSSDTLNNTEPELTKYRCVFTDAAEQEQVFHRTCEQVFHLQ